MTMLSFRQLTCKHGQHHTTTERERQGGLTIIHTTEKKCDVCGRDFLKHPIRVRERRLYASIAVGCLASVFVLGMRSHVKFDILTLLLAWFGFIVGCLAHAWWLDRFESQIVSEEREILHGERVPAYFGLSGHDASGE